MKDTQENIPQKHHFIPQFIIRNFSYNKLGFSKYYDKKRGSFSNIQTTEIFMYKNLYSVQTEKDFSKYESQIAKLIKEKFLVQDDIKLSNAEYESLLLYLALSPFRSRHALDFFKKTISEESKEFYLKYQNDGDFVSMWRRNLGEIVNCRSMGEVMKNPNIDPPFKLFMRRDSYGLFGSYLIVAERRGEEDFFLSDTYPVSIEGESKIGSIPLLRFFPISPSRIIILTDNNIKIASLEVRYFSDDFLRAPTILQNKVGYNIHVKKIYKKDVEFINNIFFKHTKEGLVVLDEERFFVDGRDVKKFS